MRPLRLSIAVILALLAAPLARAGDETPAKVSWSATATDGTTLVVPNVKPTVLAFVRADHEQSHEILKRLRSVTNARSVQLSLIASGSEAARQAESLAAAGWGWPVVTDGSYASSGQFNVHAWPTVIVIAPDGAITGRLPGLTASFGADIESYLSFAAGEIDRATLDQRLATRQTVTSAPAQVASRHVALAHRLIAHGQTEQALVELNRALEADPSSALTRLTLARVLVQSGKPVEALGELEKVTVGAVLPPQIAEVRAAALIAQGKWDEARAACVEALKLNPDPAEARYLAGLVAQHDGDLSTAAEHFRLAYETSRKRSTLGQD